MTKKDVSVSRTASGLNIYIPEEVAKVLGWLGTPLSVRQIGEKSIQLYVDKNSTSHLLENASGLPYRALFGNARLEHSGVKLAMFGPTQATWSQAGDHCITITLPDELQEPRITQKRSLKGTLPLDEFDELRRTMNRMNELMETMRECGVEFFAGVSNPNGDLQILPLTGRVSGMRIIKETF